MAGIGFELQRLSRRGGLIGQAAATGHAAFVTAGPWLVTVLALGLVQRYVVIVVSREEAYLLQALVIYSFCLTLLVTAPVTTAAIRVSADDLYERQTGRIRGNFMLAVALSCALVLVLALPLFAFGFALAGADLLLASAGAGAIAMVWPAIAFASMVRAYVLISMSFVVGLAVSVGLTLALAVQGFGAGAQAAGFGAGLGLAALALISAVLATFPGEMPSLRAPALRLVTHARRYLAMVCGAAVAVAALWADSWVVWAGPLGKAANGGLPTAPFYDSAMFMARLSILPGLISFLLCVDTEVHERTRALTAAVEDNGTLKHIRRRLDDTRQAADSTLMRLIVLQGVCCAILVLLAPAFIAPAGLRFEQIGVFRLGILGALFQAIFIAASTLVLHFGRGRAYLGLQALFLLLNLAGTAASLAMPAEWLGGGYFAAAAMAAVVALAACRAVLGSLDRLIFHDALVIRDLFPIRPVLKETKQ